MGERFGHYEIMRRLAAGGMAEVLLAKQTSLGGFERLVCLKRILAHLGSQAEFLTMFEDEARIAANLIHPNIAQIYDIAQHQGQYYIAMEYVRGEDLRRVYNQEVSQGRAIPKHVAALIVMGAAAGLDYAHRQTDLAGAPLGIVHRDVSPQNILVTYDGHVKLIDFGVAKAAGKLNQTRAGVLKGKYSYMSPEQASGDPLDGRTDIFALGITLYEITTGTRLFKRDNELETLHAVIACNVKPPSQIVPRYDSDLEQIVLRALAYDVDSRYTTAGELEHDLERYLLARGYPTSATSLAGYMQGLFAEKLADEALFGGPPWNEAATKSRKAKESDSVTSRPPTPGAQDGATAPGALGQDEATVVDPSPNEAEPGWVRATETRRETDGTPADWRAEPDSPERTAPTHSQGEGPQEATVVPQTPAEPPATVLQSPPEAPAPGPAATPWPPHRRLPRWLLAAGVVALSAGGGATLYRRVPRAVVPQGFTRAPTPFSAPGETVQPERAPRAAGGPFRIETPVPMAVFLGNQYLGDTPKLDVTLPPGVLLLKLINARDGGTIYRTVRANAQGEGRLVVGDARGTLDVEAHPWAWLQVGQHPARETPAHLELLEGEYTVTTECPNGQRQQQVVQVSHLSPARLTVPCP